ncbi:MAG TPA: DUF3667 domain-containing protein [Steroidobacteraceae bacterium]
MTSLPTPANWICPTCQRTNSPLEYCPACGERRLHPHGLTLMGVAEQALESLLHGDSRIPRTLKALLLQPGRITHAWANGERRRWMTPFQLFLFLNVIFYLAQSVSGINVLFTPLDTHLHNTFYGPLARTLIDAHLEHYGGTVSQLTNSFEHLERTNAKLLVIAMVPAFALMLRAVFPRRQRLGAIHVVFSLHFYAYLMISLSLLFLAAAIPAAFLIHRLGATTAGSIGDILFVLQIAIIVIYLWQALDRVYLLSIPRRITNLVLLTAAMWPVLVAYQLLLFLVTLHEI